AGDTSESTAVQPAGATADSPSKASASGVEQSRTRSPGAGPSDAPSHPEDSGSTRAGSQQDLVATVRDADRVNAKYYYYNTHPDVIAFRAASGTIRCVFREDAKAHDPGVRCQIDDVDYPAPVVDCHGAGAGDN